MDEPEVVDDGRVRCQARPAVVRHGWREDLLCASHANTLVLFHDADVPVCRMHEAAFTRWGEHAEANAEAFWGWSSSNTLARAE